MMRGSPLVNRVLLVPRQRSFRFILWLLKLRSERIDLALLATRQHAFWPKALRLFGGVRRIVADSPTKRTKYIAHHRTVSASDVEHRIDSNLALLEQVVGPLPRHVPELSVSKADHARAQPLLGALGISAETLLVGVHPGSEPLVPQKRYPGPQLRFALCEVLNSEPHLHMLVFFGGEPNDERDAYRALHPRLHLVEDQPFPVVTALAGRCSAFLAGDTGLAHVAAAQDVPVLIVAGPTEVRSTAPRGPGVTVVSTAAQLACMPCYGTALYGTCDHVSCMRSLPPSRVAGELRSVLRSAQPQISRPMVAPA
jgi:ADP-heptose:LPS heptosyltransferase